MSAGGERVGKLLHIRGTGVVDSSRVDRECTDGERRRDTSDLLDDRQICVATTAECRTDRVNAEARAGRRGDGPLGNNRGECPGSFDGVVRCIEHNRGEIQEHGFEDRFERVDRDASGPAEIHSELTPFSRSVTTSCRTRDVGVREPRAYVPTLEARASQHCRG